jgi:hypothetical protein
VTGPFRPLFLPVPAKAGILLPLEKGLGALAFAPDYSIKRLGPEPVPGLSRCGVSDENAMQRGSSRIGQPIRGPDAEQARQPQRVQPGDANAVS